MQFQMTSGKNSPDHGKCHRCRRYFRSVAYDVARGVPEHLALCDRCLHVVVTDHPDLPIVKQMRQAYREAYTVTTESTDGTTIPAG